MLGERDGRAHLVLDRGEDHLVEHAPPLRDVAAARLPVVLRWAAMEQRLFIPGPVTCAPEVLAAMARPTFDHRGPEFAAMLARVESAMKPIFGTEGDVLVLGASGTGGLEAAVASAFSPGDKVLSAPVGVFGKRLAAIARTYGLDVEVLETPLGAAVDPQALA